MHARARVRDVRAGQEHHQGEQQGAAGGHEERTAACEAIPAEKQGVAVTCGTSSGAFVLRAWSSMFRSTSLNRSHVFLTNLTAFMHAFACTILQSPTRGTEVNNVRHTQPTQYDI